MFLFPVRLEKLRPAPPSRERPGWRPCQTGSCHHGGLPPLGGLASPLTHWQQGGREAAPTAPCYRGAQLAEFRGILTVPC